MYKFQTIDVTDCTVNGVLERCKTASLAFSNKTRKSIVIKIDTLNCSGETTVVGPCLYSFVVLRERTEWIKDCIMRKIGENGYVLILKATMEVTELTKKCPFCSMDLQKESWWSHVKCCGCERCPECLEDKNVGDHEKCCTMVFHCRKCNAPFTSPTERRAHENICNKVIKLESAINDNFQVHRLPIIDDSPDYESVLFEQIDRVKDCVDRFVANHYPVLKYNLTVAVNMSKLIDDEVKLITFTTQQLQVTPSTDVNETARVHIMRLIEKITKQMTSEGSGWIVHNVAHLDIKITKVKMTGGSSFLKLPKELRGKRSIVNIKNYDQKCFMWSCLAHLYPVPINRTRVGNYKKHARKFDMAGVEFPVPVGKIIKIEEANKLAINVYEFDDQLGVVPFRISTRPAEYEEICLLLIREEAKAHYALISNLSGFMRNFDGQTHSNHVFYCRRCLHGFTTEKTLREHCEVCLSFPAQKVEMSKKKYAAYTAYGQTIPAVAQIISDFETYNIFRPDSQSFSQSKTRHISEMKPMSFVYKVCSVYPEFDKPPVFYEGEDAGKVFIDCMKKEREILKPLLESAEKITPLTNDEWLDFYSASCCYLCKERFDPTDPDDRVKDHCHYPLRPGQTSNYLGAAHSRCNLARCIDQRLPILFHNLMGFDLHLFFKDLCKSVPDLRKIRIIPRSSETYTQVYTKKLLFVDTQKHLSSSLDKLVKNLSNDQMIHLRNYCETMWPGQSQKFGMLTRKLVFCYDYCTDRSRLFDPIPAKANFKSYLTGSEMSDEDFDFLQEMKREFELDTVRDLLKLYNTVDTLLLCDVWCSYQKSCLKEFGLEPARFVGAPSLSYTAALKTTRKKLELIQDVSLYNLFENNIVGGISQVNHRYVRANNSRVSGYDPSKPQTHIIYIDATNQYGKAMQGFLPVGDFLPEDPQKFTKEYILSLDPEARRGYCLEVDLEIDEAFHDLLNDYPVAPNKLVIDETLISPYSKSLRSKRKQPSNFSSKKLAPNFLPKKRVLHELKNLQFYLTHGAILKAVHRVYSYKQEQWLKPFIDEVAEKRRTAQNDFERQRYKQTANATFGKFLQNVRKYKSVVLVDNPKSASFQASKPGFKHFTIFSPDLVSVESRKPSVVLDRPIYCGFSILEKSKLVMFEMYFDVIKKISPSAKILFTDTDSFLIELQSDDLNKDLSLMKEHFDFSNLPKDHVLYSTENAGVPGKFKDEVQGAAIAEFVGLRSKLYSLLLEDGSRKMAACGVKKTVADSIMTHEAYKKTLFNSNDVAIKQNVLRSVKHDVFLTTCSRTSLTSYDDKRWIQDSGITSLAYGHYKIPKNK